MINAFPLDIRSGDFQSPLCQSEIDATVKINIKPKCYNIYIRSILPYMDRDKLCHYSLNQVTKKRRERINSYLRIEDKARCLVAGLLLRQVCGVIDDDQLVYGQHGKPQLKDSDLYFNLSHSGDYVVLATADREIGIDIEKVCPRISTACHKIEAQVFTKEEQIWLQQQDNDNAFYRLWTAKESVMKLIGEGLSLSPETFSVLPLDRCMHMIKDKIFYLEWFEYDNHIISYAVYKN